MRRSSPPLQSLAAAMSARPSFHGRGRRGGGTAWYAAGRGFPYSSSAGGGYVTGDAHFQSVHDANLGLREPQAVVARDGYRFPTPRPPPPSYDRRQEFSQPHRPPDQYRSRGGNNRSQGFRPRRWDYRVWEYAKTVPPPDAERFVVLSYNILADYLANEHWWKLYKHIPRYTMDWEWRKKNILFELGLWSADVMCFQEVDRFGDLEEELNKLGYSGIWKMRTGNAIDGCAVFWRTSRFKLLKEESIEFNKLGLRDNVAQICVLELVSHCPPANTHLSSNGSNKVVICNIHVLYNPKRGEIKLGQVRLLLEKAYAVSELWDNAPVVVCGDFNCTPKSPLYNFIAEQKLDLSGVDRDKVSGQASATIHFPRSQVTGASASPNFSENPSNNFNQDPFREDNKQVAYPSEDQNLHTPEKTTSECSQLPQAGVSNYTSSSERVSEQQTIAVSVLHKQTLETQQVIAGSCGDGTKSAVSSTVGSDDVHPETDDVLREFVSEVDLDSCAAIPELISSSEENAESNKNDVEQREKMSAVNSYSQGECELSHSNLCTGSPSSMHLSLQEGSDEVSLRTTAQAGFSHASTVRHDAEDKVRNVPVAVGTAEEDEESFFSAPHDVNDPLPPDIDATVIPESDSPPGESNFLLSDDVVNDSSWSLYNKIADAEKTMYSPSLWTPMEIATATGDAQCITLNHLLALSSTYTEVQDTSGTRDSHGEPLATSCNRCFLGTVDYIWRSEGLQTVKVLTPMQKNSMQQTGGFPTKKWGSDHIALASQLAFTRASIKTTEDQ